MLQHWCEHKPSVTISVNEDEWLGVADWCWRNFDDLKWYIFFTKLRTRISTSTLRRY